MREKLVALLFYFSAHAEVTESGGFLILMKYGILLQLKVEEAVVRHCLGNSGLLKLTVQLNCYELTHII